jgi:hypothetical protein
VLEEKHQISAREIATIGLVEKIWIVEGFHIQEAIQEERREGMI